MRFQLALTKLVSRVRRLRRISHARIDSQPFITLQLSVMDGRDHARPRSISQNRFSTSEPKEHAFNDAANCTLQNILDSIEALIDKGVLEIDISLEAGVLTIDCGENGVFVLNKQTPNRQIWLASPVSGPFRYNYTPSGEWLSTRDGYSLQSRLKAELESICKLEVNF